MKQEVVRTADNSTTIFLEEWNEHYHSKHGAVQEAMHVFIKNGVEQMQMDKFSVLEVGFGTGLNAFLTAIWAQENKKMIDYTTIEAYPLEPGLIKELDFGDLHHKNSGLFRRIHDTQWEIFQTVNESFSINKKQMKLADFNAKAEFDLIYFDAFGPRVQPEMWTVESLQICYTALQQNGLFVTYCAQGQMKRNLKDCGFSVKSVPGPPGKREMTVAQKI